MRASGGSGADADLRLPRRAVERIAGHRVTQRGKVHANLVRAPGVQIGFDQRVSGNAQADSPIGARCAAFPAACGHTDSSMQIARHGKLDAAGIFLQFAVKQSNVSFFNLAAAELPRESAMRQIIPRDKKHA